MDVLDLPGTEGREIHTEVVLGAASVATYTMIQQNGRMGHAGFKPFII